ncbi:MAG: glycine cleavage system aminomethyltransferase GcvT [Gammaproteobacteria bacterium]|nr:glycine cleavage system aminomethyltransferase GcvT [Gammaproteobacteria bacterium]
MSLQTPLYDAHRAAGGKIVDFAGWQLPVHYGSLIDEHKAVRKSAGMFDVSHMTVVDFSGSGTNEWLRQMLTNDVNKISVGQAIYGCMCNESGGVIDDLIAYRRGDTDFRIVVNAATRQQDLDWFGQHLPANVQMDTPEGLAMLAIQGPEAVQLCSETLREHIGARGDLDDLQRFGCITLGDWFVARTGYTGEDGVEVVMPASAASDLWASLFAVGIVPAGLGARDTLRLEAGLCLYGNDLDLQHSPIEAGLAWAVDINDTDRQFIGREVLEDQKLFGAPHRQIGLVLDSRGVLRAGQVVEHVGREVGVITSGTFSPTLERSIAMARVTKEIKGGCDVVVRDKPLPATVVPVPFIKNGEATFA